MSIRKEARALNAQFLVRSETIYQIYLHRVVENKSSRENSFSGVDNFVWKISGGKKS
jgi:hypothetical protein